jgi:hypothetical protein
LASCNAFFTHLTAVMPIASAALAVVLWPIVFLDVNLHLS